MACFNQVLLFSRRQCIVNLCRHSLEPDYAVRIVHESEVPQLSPLLLSCCMVIIDMEVYDVRLKKLVSASSVYPVFIYSQFIQTPCPSGALSSDCVPFPCDASVIRSSVDRKALSAPESGQMSCSQRTPPYEASPCADFAELIGDSRQMRRVKRQLAEVAARSISVLLVGESGTGKTFAAELIHRHSSRRGHSFIPVNMAALPEGLAESELFGTVPGAYTGAVRRQGKFPMADGGTLFMDEIAETSMQFQSKLLGITEGGAYFSVGSDVMHHADVRLISAAKSDLLSLALQGKFREDLYYRIAGYIITIPPLRDREGDIRIISENLAGKKGKTLSADAQSMLDAYGWPGNVRQLISCIERASVMACGDVIRSDHIQFA